MGRLLAEGAGVVIVGVAVALAANALSPKGLSLTRNYFPHAAPTAPPGPIAGIPPRTAGQPDTTNSVMAELAAKVEAEGLKWADSDAVEQLFSDPRREQDLVLFLDARNDAHYAEGHIPGAYQLDPYRPETYLGLVLPVCEQAEQIVVYCNGGDCEDSKIAAVLLANLGVAKAKFQVYLEGMPDWTAKGRPVETGARKSGVIQQAPP